MYNIYILLFKSNLRFRIMKLNLSFIPDFQIRVSRLEFELIGEI